ncbi:glycosyl hydrolase 115 family protein [Metabacillus bambusae]|uniref:Glycosyl hydrolase 115 family protein n=1 Tax=Metabacillus bambusae TaxID=2795218 RepID=A0ABS3N7P9_9BACI|nr:glycosyl hydrolase 115 family protein [Metabacillus bambusae]MBO1514061.1 glycosyl hydrolase 115 family protein [Metabacillus bambusae]
MNNENYFIFNKETCLDYQGPELKSVNHFLKVLTRDKDKVFQGNSCQGNTTILFVLDERNDDNLKTEQYSIQFSDDLSEMRVVASDELGIIYGMLYVSEKFLGVDKFWFWNDCEPSIKTMVKINPVDILSGVAKIKFRGWFINDEVLISKWKYKNSNTIVWEMVFEALLRCNGNMVIPGTDIENPVYKNIASEMGLWITHHHAEPLGAQMFNRVYPNENASYIENETLFKKLWNDAIIEQQNDKVIWNIGFRGQGDRPFWIDDPTFDTDEKRGALISKIMRDQYEMIAEYERDPVCCVNLYGEITELYKKGLLELPEGVIKIWADSGYGKMVTRRQGSHNPRIPSIPSKHEKGPHGIYYHVTFYDLQASNHLSMLPNTTAFVNDELSQAFDNDVCEFLIVNCGNIRPHLYFLDFVSQLWNKGKMDSAEFLNGYVSQYYPSYTEEMIKYMNAYFDAIIQYGNFDDERAGEQFYHFTIRNLAKQWIVSQGNESAKNVYWATGKTDLKKQFDWFKNKVEGKLSIWESLLETVKALVGEASTVEQKRIHDQLLIQVQIHKNGCKALYSFTKAFEKFQTKEYLDAYLLLNDAMQEIKETMDIMEKPTYDKWQGYYDNDCLTNVSLTFYTLETVRRNLRMFGDGPTFYNWEKRYLTETRESSVMLLTNKTKQLMDDELINGLEGKSNYPN